MPGRVLFRAATELVANRLVMDGDITWTIVVGTAQRRPFQSEAGGRQEELAGLKRSLMEGRRLAERLRSIKSEPAVEEKKPRDTERKRDRVVPIVKTKYKKKKMIIKKQGTLLKKERPRGLTKEKKEPPAVERQMAKEERAAREREEQQNSEQYRGGMMSEGKQTGKEEEDMKEERRKEERDNRAPGGQEKGGEEEAVHT